MKIKNINILALLGVGLIILLTTSPTIKDVHGALSAPASYDLNYQYDAVYEETFMLGTTSIGDRNVIYTRTSDGAYYNYTTTISNDIPSLDIVPEGLSITMTFNRSNTNWFSITGGYLPADTKIGSDNFVGTIINKLYLNFNNQTSKDYYLYLDTSSTTVGHNLYLTYNNNSQVNNTSDRYIIGSTSILNRYIIPSYYEVILSYESSSNLRYFDAWYLKDLGLSSAYDAGLDIGYGQGQDDADLLVTGFSAMVGILVNFVLMIANLEVLGVSLMGVFAVIILITGIVWTLKLIRG